MGQTADQIEAYIQGKRDALRSNFVELENKVKAVADWRRHFEKHPATMMAAAIGVGALLATVSRGRNRHHVRTMSSGELRASAGPSHSSDYQQRGLARQTWDPIKASLLGLVVTRATGFVVQLLRGPEERLKNNGSAKGEPSRSSGDSEGSNNLQGEGDYEAARRYRSDVEGFVKTADIERAAREAAPLNKQEAAEMAAAEEAARKRAKPA